MASDAQDRDAANVSPFDKPTIVCRDCGREDEHTYCIRWMEWLHRLFGAKA